MITAILLAATCAPPVLTDRTGLGFADALGQATVARATSVCLERYHGCLVRLTRVRPMDFQAICRRTP